jgi:nitrate reductase delta subunit
LVSGKRPHENGDLMSISDSLSQILLNFADMLDYPSSRLSMCIQDCIEELNRLKLGNIQEILHRYSDFVQESTLGSLEELYTEIFDIGTSHCLYAGYHLLGDSYERSLFLQGLNERYAAAGFSHNGELPDHLPVMLRFLASGKNVTLANELIQDALLPVLKKMQDDKSEGSASKSEKFNSIYLPVLRALQQLLSGLNLDEQTNN